MRKSKKGVIIRVMKKPMKNDLILLFCTIFFRAAMEAGKTKVKNNARIKIINRKKNEKILIRSGHSSGLPLNREPNLFLILLELISVVLPNT